jgi:hypothetical protein
MNKTIRRAAGLAAVLALLPLSARAQSPEQRIENALARALQAGVPVELLESKVALGRARGYPADQIALGIERRLETLQQVKAAFGDRHQLTTEELGVAADAVQGGVSQTALAAVSERAPRDRRAVAIAVLTELVRLGHASDQALARVTQALEGAPDALTNLPAQAQGRGGGAPEGVPGRGAGAQNGRGGPPASVQPGGPGASGRGRGRGGPPGEG